MMKASISFRATFSAGAKKNFPMRADVLRELITKEVSGAKVAFLFFSVFDARFLSLKTETVHALNQDD
jgi:hypothetical protein